MDISTLFHTLEGAGDRTGVHPQPPEPLLAQHWDRVAVVSWTQKQFHAWTTQSNRFWSFISTSVGTVSSIPDRCMSVWVFVFVGIFMCLCLAGIKDTHVLYMHSCYTDTPQGCLSPTYLRVCMWVHTRVHTHTHTYKLTYSIHRLQNTSSFPTYTMSLSM